MKVLGSYEKARIYIERHSEHDEKVRARKLNPGPTITISRETGIGAAAIGQHLADYLNDSAIEYYNDWTYFDKDLINRIMEDNHMPAHFRKFLEDQKVHTIDSWFNEMLGISPSKIALLKKTKRTIEQLAGYGNSIIVGRGANVILSDHKMAFHLRLVAPLSHRIETAMQLYKIDHKTAAEFITQEDEIRRIYLWKYFHKKVDDPLLYHAIINTNRLTIEEIAIMIGHCVQKRFPHFFISHAEVIE